MEPLPPMKRKASEGKRIKRLPSMPGNAVNLMPPLPNLKDRVVVDRNVHWRFKAGDVAATGWCARCHTEQPAVELRWRPDRVAFGEHIQGSWECRHCNPRPGKYEVLGIRPR